MKDYVIGISKQKIEVQQLMINNHFQAVLRESL